MSKSNLTATPDNVRTYSYRTCIKETLPDGRTIGNVTYYSSSTRKHQSKANVYRCDILLDSVPYGTPSLRDWYTEQWKAGTLKRVELGAVRRHKIMTDGLIVYTRFPSSWDGPCVSNDLDAPTRT